MYSTGKSKPFDCESRSCLRMKSYWEKSLAGKPIIRSMIGTFAGMGMPGSSVVREPILPVRLVPPHHAHPGQTHEREQVQRQRDVRGAEQLERVEAGGGEE